MRQYIDVTGKTDNDAIAAALRQLNMDRDDVSVEILERARSGFLGIGASPAKVRVYYGPEEEEAPIEPVKPEIAPREKAELKEKPEPKAKLKPKAEDEPKTRPERKSEEKTAPRSERKSEPRQDRPKRSDRPRRQPSQEAASGEQPSSPAPVRELGEEVNDEKAQAIRSFLTGLLEQMEASASIKVYQPEKGRYKVILEGERMGALIGRRGETLDAIQQLTSYAVNRGGNRVRVQLDAEGYREKREQSLRHLARKVAGKVVRYRRNVTLEPMNAYERHVIHVALQDVPNVTTYSTGVDPNRRVIVAYDREKQ